MVRPRRRPDARPDRLPDLIRHLRAEAAQIETRLTQKDKLT